MWYAYGDIVLDRLLGVHRAADVAVFFEGQPPAPDMVRESLNLGPETSVSISDCAPRIICSLDMLVLSSNGDLCNVSELVPLGDAETLPAFSLVEYNLSAEDLVRLGRWRRRYPELKFGTLLTARLNADVAHLEQLSAKFPDLRLLLQHSRYV